MTAPLEAALATGLPCFPCGRNKSPAIPGEGGHKHATDNPTALRALWREHPGPLVGVPTGEASGLAVLDVDLPKYREAARWLAANRNRLPQTRIHGSRSGGLHFVFEHAPGVRNSQGRLARGVDTRAEGGYVIWWPAAGCPVVCKAPLAPWPQWLTQVLWPAPARPALRGGPGGSDAQVLRRLARRVIHTPKGERNGVLFWAACRLAEEIRNSKIDEQSGVAVLIGAALRAGLPEGEARGTIASGLKAKPR
jgi:hypothetical protein